jgi:predicted NBD/HSP70 family sugar kinase
VTEGARISDRGPWQADRHGDPADRPAVPDPAPGPRTALPDLPEKATHQQTRAFNQQLVLRAIYNHEATSRAEIARLTGLTRTTVSDLVAELLRSGLVEEIGRGPSSGGKAPILLQVVPQARYLIGVDLGEDVFRGAVVDLRGEIVRAHGLPLEGRDGAAAVEVAFELIDHLRQRDDRPLLGIGVAAPGLIDSGAGVVRWAVNLDWSDLPLGKLIGERYGVPVGIVNDSQAAALAELTFHRRLRPANMVVIRVGRGLGAGIILDGQLFHGDGSGAGEIGHTPSPAGTRRCRCGNIGCLETVASLHAMVEAAAARDPSIRDDDALVARFRSGDPIARQAVRDAGRALGLAVAGLIGTLNVRHVVLVGPAVALGPEWLREVRDAARSGALPLLARDTLIEIGHAREDAILLGASAHLMTEQLGLAAGRR